MKRYSNYKPDTNSRGLPTGAFTTPEPKHEANSAADASTDVGQSFHQLCKNASERIQGLRQEGDPSVTGLPDTVEPTARQYRRYRNGHGLAYKFSR